MERVEFEANRNWEVRNIFSTLPLEQASSERWFLDSLHEPKFLQHVSLEWFCQNICSLINWIAVVESNFVWLMQSRTKWNGKSMCLFRWFIDKLCAVSIAPLLSTPILIRVGFVPLVRSFSSRDNIIASFAAELDAMHSASQIEVATQICFFDLQLIAPPAARKIAPLVDFRDVLHPPQSALENPSILNDFDPSYRIPK